MAEIKLFKRDLKIKVFFSPHFSPLLKLDNRNLQRKNTSHWERFFLVTGNSELYYLIYIFFFKSSGIKENFL